VAGSAGLDVTEDLIRFAREGWRTIADDDKERLKWVGVFQRRPTPGHFMMRIRMPNGIVTAAQCRLLGEITKQSGRNVADVTTRQQVQLRWVTIEGVPEIMARLDGAGLTSLQTGMDNIRGIIGCPATGLTPNELFDTAPIAREFQQIFVGNKAFTNLPRKFNVTITGCVENCTHDESQDVALVPAIRRDRVGFNVLVGGKMGSGGFTIASPLDVFVWIPKAAQLVAALVSIFRDHGPRDARSKCRFAFLIEEWGIPRLREELARRVDHYLEPAGRDVRSQFHSDHLDITAQKQPGLRSVGLCVPFGRMNPQQMDELARVAEEYGDGEIRLTTGQNAILANVSDERLDALRDEDLLSEFSPHPSRSHRRVVACTGTDYCNLAQIDTKGHAAELSRQLEHKIAGRGRAFSFHWSGCPAGCGNHQGADIGFRGFKTRIDGKTVDAVAIYTGGCTGPSASEGKELMEMVPLDQNLPDVVARLVRSLETGEPQAAEPIPSQEFPGAGTADDQREAHPEPRG